MKLSPIVLRLRAANLTRFGNRIVGAAEMALALANSLVNETAFVVQINEKADVNSYDSSADQKITEIFSVIVALKNDISQADKTGLTAYDSVYDIRTELLRNLLGWKMDDDGNTEALTLVEYSGGKVLDINPGWLWFQFDFQVQFRIQMVIDTDGMDSFVSLYTQAVMSPNEHIPLIGADNLPVDTSWPDINSIIDFSENTNPYAFTRAFGYGFKISEE